MRGRDPDDSEVVLGDVAEDLTKAVALLEEIQGELRSDVDADAPPEPPRVVPLAGRRLDERAIDVVHTISLLGGEHDTELLPLALLLSMKSARIASYVTNGVLDAVWPNDGAPNVLLLDHLARALRAELARDREGSDRSDSRRALDLFDRALRPLLEGAEPYRAHLDALVAAGDAPSPFAHVERAPRDA